MDKGPRIGDKAAGLARHWLSQAERSAKSLKGKEAADAMHDLRTSVRRLRVVLSAYHEHLGPAGARSMREDLRALTRLTSASRDAQVWSTWLQKNGAPCEITHRLIIHLDAVAEHCRQDFLAQGLAKFKSAARELEDKLDRVKPGKVLFSKAAAAAVRKAAKALGRRLKPVRRKGTPAQMHVARIRVKRLRYLLEPFARGDAKARKMVGRLRELHDLLGTLHDLHQLMECGVAPASEPARLEAQRLERDFRRRWLKTGQVDQMLSAAQRWSA